MRDFHMPGRSAVFAANGMCATSHPLAAEVAVGILREGGNAVDAAIAGAVLLGFCEPQMTGLGGDCFVLLAEPDGTVAALNGSGRAPAATDAAALRARGATIDVASADSVTVPGAVDAFCRLSAECGRLPLDRVLAPAIHYADAGVPVAPRVAFDWAAAADALQGVARETFLIGGRAPRAGQVFRAPGQAEALRRIAAEGRAGFYEGEVAEDMAAALAAAGGSHTAEDFAATASDTGEPVSGSYRGTDLLEHPPNGQGATAILLAGILAHFNLAAMDPWGADRAHLEIEASKLAYDARDRFVADPDHSGGVARMLDPATAERLAALIDPRRAMADPRSAAEAVHRDTVYITVVDEDRLAVSLIYSIFHAFGSGIASPRFGILFHNRGASFRTRAGPPERDRPGQAADAHHHPGDAAPGGAGHGAIWGHGRPLPGDWARPIPVEPRRLRPRPAGRHRCAAALLGGRRGEGRAGLLRGRPCRAGRAGPPGRPAGRADRRRPGDPHRP